MDRRQQKTRAAIFDALAQLLTEKQFHQITVQEIIDKANVGRSTFYAHFETKDHLLKELCTDLFSHVFSDSLTTENTHDFSGSKGSVRELVTHLLYHLRDDKRNIMGILSCESGELFLRYFREYLYGFFEKTLLPELSAKQRESMGHAGAGYSVKTQQKALQQMPQDFLIHHLSCSFIGTVQWWLSQNLAQTPEQMATWFLAATSFSAALSPKSGCGLSLNGR